MSSKVKTIFVSCTAYFYVQIYNGKEDYNIYKKKEVNCKQTSRLGKVIFDGGIILSFHSEHPDKYEKQLRSIENWQC